MHRRPPSIDPAVESQIHHEGSPPIAGTLMETDKEVKGQLKCMSHGVRGVQ